MRKSWWKVQWASSYRFWPWRVDWEVRVWSLVISLSCVLGKPSNSMGKLEKLQPHEPPGSIRCRLYLTFFTFIMLVKFACFSPQDVKLFSTLLHGLASNSWQRFFWTSQGRTQHYTLQTGKENAQQTLPKTKASNCWQIRSWGNGKCCVTFTDTCFMIYIWILAHVVHMWWMHGPVDRDGWLDGLVGCNFVMFLGRC